MSGLIVGNAPKFDNALSHETQRQTLPSMNNPPWPAARSPAIRRTDYLIDSHHVSFESGAGWYCLCAEFAAANDCRHTREAQGRHAAQVLISNRVLATIDRTGYRR